jgi:hypothetical protein
MTFWCGQRVVCVLNGQVGFISYPFGVPTAALGIVEPENGAVYVVEAIEETLRGPGLRLVGLETAWDARAFRPAVDDPFEALAAIAADPGGALKETFTPATAAGRPAPLPDGRGGPPETASPLPSLFRTPAPPDTRAAPASHPSSGASRHLLPLAGEGKEAS